MKLVIGKTHLVLTAATRKRDPTVVVAVVALAMFPVHVFALRAGIGWDDDLPLRLWPAWHLEDGDLCFAWCGLFVGATHRDGPGREDTSFRDRLRIVGIQHGERLAGSLVAAKGRPRGGVQLCRAGRGQHRERKKRTHGGPPGNGQIRTRKSGS